MNDSLIDRIKLWNLYIIDTPRFCLNIRQNANTRIFIKTKISQKNNIL
jgi:hypothetical protein